MTPLERMKKLIEERAKIRVESPPLTDERVELMNRLLAEGVKEREKELEESLQEVRETMHKHGAHLEMTSDGFKITKQTR